MLNAEEIDYSLYDQMNLEPSSRETTLNIDPEAAAEMRKKLQMCKNHWDAAQGFRERRERSVKFLRGDQWYELVEQADGSMVREDDYIASKGKVAQVNNQIRPLVKSLIGQFLENEYKPQVLSRHKEEVSTSEMMTNALWAVHDLNNMKYLDVRLFEEFLVSGAFGWRLSNDWFPEMDAEDIVADPLDMTRVFWNSDLKDPRLKDLWLIGELHDIPLEKVLQTFAENEKDEEIIRGWYANVSKNHFSDNIQEMGTRDYTDTDFFTCDEYHKCRVIEVWEEKVVKKMMVHDTATGDVEQTDYTLDEIDQLNEERIIVAQQMGIPIENVPLLIGEEKMENVFFYSFLTPQGQILSEGESKFEHQKTPYCVNFYPMLDGKCWGFVEDTIDQQKSINRYFTYLDFILGTSAKGVLMVPKHCVPEGWDEDDFTNAWTSPDGVIFYDEKPGQNIPREITSNSTSVGGQQLLAMSLELLKDSSGVHGAIQGKAPESGTSGTLYNQQATNSSISNKDYFETFYNGMGRRDFKIVQLIQQYYTQKRNTNISGKDFEDENYNYDPVKARDAHYRVVIGKTSNTPVYRQMMDQFLIDLFDKQAIDLTLMLENSSMPFADKLLAQIQKRQVQEQAQAQEQGMMPQQMQQ
jgi:hypothetical protein